MHTSRLAETFPKNIVQNPVDLASALDNNPFVRMIVDHDLKASAGLTEQLRSQIAEAAHQLHIAEFCPNDHGRFGTAEAARKWQNKGRELVTIHDETDTLLAYFWSGVEKNGHLPDHPITTAYRVT